MAGVSKKVLIAKLVSLVTSWSAGSGDPEKKDGADLVSVMSSCLSTPDACQQFKVDIAQLEKRVCKMMNVADLGDWQKTVPQSSTEPVQATLVPHTLGIDARHRITGKAKTVRILEVVVELLEAPFDSVSQPLQVESPTGVPAGARVPDFSINYFQGYTRSMALICALKAIVDTKLTDPDLQTLLPQVAAMLRFQVVFMPTMTMAEKVNKGISAKMSQTERLRLDPIQLKTALEARALSEGFSLKEKLFDYVEARDVCA